MDLGRNLLASFGKRQSNSPRAKEMIVPNGNEKMPSINIPLIHVNIIYGGINLALNPHLLIDTNRYIRMSFSVTFAGIGNKSMPSMKYHAHNTGSRHATWIVIVETLSNFEPEDLVDVRN